MIVGPSPSQRYTWSCPDCGKTGWSSTRHGAATRLRTHWRNCPDPRRTDPVGSFCGGAEWAARQQP